MHSPKGAQSHLEDDERLMIELLDDLSGRLSKRFQVAYKSRPQHGPPRTLGL